MGCVGDLNTFLRNSFCQVSPSSGKSVRDKKEHIIIQFSKCLEFIQVDYLKGFVGKTSRENIILLMFWGSEDTISPKLRVLLCQFLRF